MSNKEIFEAIEGLVQQLDGDTAGIIVIGAYDDEEGNGGNATGICLGQGSAWRTCAAIMEDPRALKALARAAGLYSMLKAEATAADE